MMDLDFILEVIKIVVCCFSVFVVTNILIHDCVIMHTEMYMVRSVPNYIYYVHDYLAMFFQNRRSPVYLVIWPLAFMCLRKKYKLYKLKRILKEL